MSDQEAEAVEGEQESWKEQEAFGPESRKEEDLPPPYTGHRPKEAGQPSKAVVLKQEELRYS